jgi:hypothetical protein
MGGEVQTALKSREETPVETRGRGWASWASDELIF